MREDGLADRTFGFIPWSDVGGYRMVNSMFTPGFGYNLKKGAQPPRLNWLFQIQGRINRATGMPARCFRKQMTIGGCEPMRIACRLARPELEL